MCVWLAAAAAGGGSVAGRRLEALAADALGGWEEEVRTNAALPPCVGEVCTFCIRVHVSCAHTAGVLVRILQGGAIGQGGLR